MASVRAVVPIEARKRARGRIEADGDSPLLLLRCAHDVEELRRLAGDQPRVLRAALAVLQSEFRVSRDPATGLAAALLVQALAAGEAS